MVREERKATLRGNLNLMLLRSLVVIHLRNRPNRVWRLRSFHRMPQDTVEQIFGTQVGSTQREPSGELSKSSKQRIGNLLRLRIHFVEPHVRRDRSKRC